MKNDFVPVPTPDTAASETRCIRCGREIRQDDAGDWYAVKPVRRSNPFYCVRHDNGHLPPPQDDDEEI